MSLEQSRYYREGTLAAMACIYSQLVRTKKTRAKNCMCCDSSFCASEKIRDFCQDCSQVYRRSSQKCLRAQIMYTEHIIYVCSDKFVVKCRLVSTICHPRIVQFFGVCYFPRLRLPALVMENMSMSSQQPFLKSAAELFQH